LNWSPLKRAFYGARSWRISRVHSPDWRAAADLIGEMHRCNGDKSFDEHLLSDLDTEAADFRSRFCIARGQAGRSSGGQTHATTAVAVEVCTVKV